MSLDIKDEFTTINNTKMEIYEAAVLQFVRNNTKDLTVFSKIPEACKDKFCLIGIDEAGRGPVLGPMVYGIFAAVIDVKIESAEEMPSDPSTFLNSVKKLNDSKQLTEKVRDEIFAELVDDDRCAFGLKFISPTQISSKSFRRQKYSLNEISHQAAIELMQGFIDAGVRMFKVFVDTVGPMDKYQAKLQTHFPEVTIKVDQKADSKYKSVSAASIFAKVARDRVLKDWLFPLGQHVALENGGWGSGYPADPATKKFLLKNINPVFGFPNIVRNSWSTAETLLTEKAVKVKWESANPEEESTPKIKKFFGVVKKETESEASNVKAHSLKKRKSLFFTYRCLEQTVEL